MKKILILIIIHLFASSSIALASLNSNTITVPQLPGTFSIAIQENYLQTTTTGHDLLLTEAPPANVSLHPGYNWGFAGGAYYIFSETGNDLGVNYFHLNNRSNRFLSVPETLEDINIPMIADISLSSKYTIDQVDLTIGQYVNIRNRLQTHLLTGFRWLKFDRKLTAFETLFNTPSGDENIGISGSGYRIQNSNSQAAGPLIAIDSSYNIGEGISFITNVDFALLANRNNSQELNYQTLTVIFPPDIVLTGNATMRTIAKETNIVPVMDMELGMSYQHSFDLLKKTNMIIKTGWRLSEYFNVVNKVTADTSQIKKANVGLNGPFIELIYQI